MKYIISRSSHGLYSDESPYEGAIRHKVAENDDEYNRDHIYTIDIDDIHDFIRKNGRVVIMKAKSDVCEFELEIYDSYRE
jgi:hypothetical protein